MATWTTLRAKWRCHCDDTTPRTLGAKSIEGLLEITGQLQAAGALKAGEALFIAAGTVRVFRPQ